MSLIFGISTMIYSHENIEKLLPILTDIGVNNIEIRPNIHHFELDDSKVLDNLKKKIENHHLSVSAIHMPMKSVDISCLEEYNRVRSVREVEKTVLAAYRLDAPLIVVHPGGMCRDISKREERLKNSIVSLTEIAEFCNQWNVKLTIENTPPGRIGDSWIEIKKIIDELESDSVGICLDIGHHLLNNDNRENDKISLDLEEKLGELKTRILHIHIHDNDGKEDLHLLPGEGLLPWSSFLSFLKKINYNNTLILELKNQTKIDIKNNKINSVFSALGENS